jgi:serine acetyltransferase
MEIHIGIVDLLIIYLLPVLCIITGIFLFLIVLYILILIPFLKFDFKYDLMYLFESQKNLKRFKNKSMMFFRFYFKTMLGDNGTQALFLYRMSRWFHNSGFRIMSDLIHRLSKFLTDTDISPYATIGHGLMIYHGSGVVIGKNTKLGDRCLVCQGVTTGSGAPQIGNNVKLWAGAKILGTITIGDHSEVGANAVLTKSLDAYCIAVGIPATRIISKKREDQ